MTEVFRHKTTSPWSEERVDLLKTLWNKGESASAIAKALGGGVSRSAVCAKVHRLGLSGQPQIHRVGRPKVKQGAPRPAPAVVLATKPPPSPKPVPPKPVNWADPPPTARPWLERAFGECAFPFDGPDGTLSCCAPTGGARYCEDHRAVMWRPKPPKPPRVPSERRRVHDEISALRRWA